MIRRILLGAAVLLAAFLGAACAVGGQTASSLSQENAPVWQQMEPSASLPLEYARQFTVDFYDGGYAQITVNGQEKYLVVPQGAAVPDGLEAETVVLQQPLENIYVASTSAMDLFCPIDALDQVRFCSLNADEWYVEEVAQAIRDGRMLYAGKYNAPDYECLLENGCSLSVQNTMIYHKPESKEQLEALGIPVLVERSSYESHPLGRMEWIKVYGVLTGRLAEAEDYFESQCAQLDEVLQQENTGKTVAFFAINSNGSVTVRKSGDYVAEMIRLAGGEYVFADLQQDGNALSTMNMQMEAFYAGAHDADYLIYNSTIDGEIKDLEQLFAKSDLLRDFKAVQNGNVWCTEKSLFQQSTGFGTMILDIHNMLTDPDAAMTYLYRLS